MAKITGVINEATNLQFYILAEKTVTVRERDGLGKGKSYTHEINCEIVGFYFNQQTFYTLHCQTETVKMLCVLNHQ